ncbi:MAG: hypothetical protein LBS75_05315 [Synergistaceae bacterium]|jgi:hypothetical protein|nr:hypothetical protein [Synergistaceae bacterium]
MIITIDIMKKLNDSLVSSSPLSFADLAKECYLDEKLLACLIGELDRPVTSMKTFFSAVDDYLVEMRRRVKMLDECYTAIQHAQMEQAIITVTPDDPAPPIVWW